MLHSMKTRKRKVGEVTPSSHVREAKMAEEILNQIEGKIKCVIADGAHDKKAARQAVAKREARSLIPPPKNGR